ncbi:Dolichyl-diphosphooligosaccharide--protein glycosyltransferase subunit DAD1 [Thelohanellus kitauei]|uniref:Dolichyl-diphosphooligosaccharide--protein glycosyltransferase subunit DAD1 n=1 Tax=Thelohanellus kitauei TaxID=669202 RepID=A0A0C2J103_THEKT|nr:Dolichyl-diphosphooligosaccharide--protein glycosyltransferase subunit DAD1 [Thelohanellus kitauei]
MVTYRKPKLPEQKKAKTVETRESLLCELKTIFTDYMEKTEQKLLIIDSYLVIVMLMGVLNFAYCILFMPKPFHKFISAFISCIGSFVLGVSLRMQLDPESESSFPEVTHRKALFDFIFAHIILHAVVINYIG